MDTQKVEKLYKTHKGRHIWGYGEEMGVQEQWIRQNQIIRNISEKTTIIKKIIDNKKDLISTMIDHQKCKKCGKEIRKLIVINEVRGY